MLTVKQMRRREDTLMFLDMLADIALKSDYMVRLPSLYLEAMHPTVRLSTSAIQSHERNLTELRITCTSIKDAVSSIQRQKHPRYNSVEEDNVTKLVDVLRNNVGLALREFGRYDENKSDREKRHRRRNRYFATADS